MKKTYLTIAFIFLLCPSFVSAENRLYFDLEERVVGINKVFLVALKIDADESVNAVTLRINLPKNLEIVDFSDADSIINYWIEKEAQNKDRLVVSGLIPGGFKGVGARIGILTLKANATAVSVLSFDPENTLVFKNSPVGEKSYFKLIPSDFEVLEGKDNSGGLGPDVFPPESFSPEIGRFPEDGDPYHVFFQAQDKDSGIYFYEVAESKKEKKNFNSLEWRRAQSPEILEDQSLRSFVYVKAVDKKGLERVVVLSPVNKSSWLAYNFHYIILIVILLVVFWFNKRYAKYPKN